MKTLLICPAERTPVQFLSEITPLAIAPLLGQSLLEYWLSHLAATEVKEVCILASDRPEQAKALVGDGVRWGIRAEVLAESRELTVAQAELKYAKELSGNPGQQHTALLDHFPSEPERPLFNSYNDWFAALLAWMPRALTADRVGHREVRPGVWLGMNSSLSPTARLLEPCWVGQNVFVGARAVIGPRAVVENGVFIEPDTEINHSCVGPLTFVGRYTEIKDSLAWGNTLIQLGSGSLAKVPDPFVLCSLRQPWHAGESGWLRRMAGLRSAARESDPVSLKDFVINRQS